MTIETSKLLINLAYEKARDLEKVMMLLDQEADPPLPREILVFTRHLRNSAISLFHELRILNGEIADSTLSHKEWKELWRSST